MIRPRFEELLDVPPLDPDQWCEVQPCVDIAGIVVSQPSSSVLVLAVSALALGIGAHTWRTREGHASRAWWALTFLLGGVGALAAGVSFQAFGYELKCAGRTLCTWTSWFEIAYNLLTVAAASSGLLALSHQFKDRAALLRSAARITLAIFLAATIIGVTRPLRFLLSFEFLVIALVPSLLFGLVALGRCISPFASQALRSGGMLIAAWLAYWLYAHAGCSEVLWEHRWWVSENDIFHVGMGIWLLHVKRRVLPLAEDGLEKNFPHLS